jgi:hypothetical protein
VTAMARKKKKAVNIVTMTTGEFAKLAEVTRKTVCSYCLRIKDGQTYVLKELGEMYGLVGIQKIANKWALTVETRAQ